MDHHKLDDHLEQVNKMANELCYYTINICN